MSDLNEAVEAFIRDRDLTGQTVVASPYGKRIIESIFGEVPFRLLVHPIVPRDQITITTDEHADDMLRHMNELSAKLGGSCS